MHAAGMPGMTTFANISAVQNASHTFYFGYNKKDKILQKKVIVFKFPARFSSTTLGCNKRNEAVKVVEFAGSRALENNFFAAPTSTLSEHDIFCYVQQPEFKRFFNRFMTKVKRP